MQADVLSFLPFNVNPNFSLESLFLASVRDALFQRNNVGCTLHYVVARAWRHTLGKFAAMIGNEIPVRSLFSDWVYVHFDSVEWVLVGTIGSAKNQAVILYQLLIFVSI
jgi:hypothetical protein